MLHNIEIFGGPRFLEARCGRTVRTASGPALAGRGGRAKAERAATVVARAARRQPGRAPGARAGGVGATGRTTTGAARQPPRAVPGPVEGHGRARARARLLVGRPRPRARTERRSSGMPLMACAARAVPDGSRRVAGRGSWCARTRLRFGLVCSTDGAVQRAVRALCRLAHRVIGNAQHLLGGWGWGSGPCTGQSTRSVARLVD